MDSVGEERAVSWKRSDRRTALGSRIHWAVAWHLLATTFARSFSSINGDRRRTVVRDTVSLGFISRTSISIPHLDERSRFSIFATGAFLFCKFYYITSSRVAQRRLPQPWLQSIMPQALYWEGILTRG